MGGKTGAISGYLYSMALHMGLCRGPIDQLVAIRVDTKNCPIPGGLPLNDGANVYLNDPNLFGGSTAEGGIAGAFLTFFGAKTQVIPSGIKTLMGGGNIPDFRGLASVWYNGEISANNPYLKTWEFRVRRTISGWYNDACWYPEKCKIQIAAALIKYYHQPTAGDTITFNGNVVTYIAINEVPVGAQIAQQQETGLDARALMNFLNANQTTYGLFATANNADGSNDQVTVTLLNTSPNAPKYTITTSATNFNPLLVNNVLQNGGITAMNPAHIIYQVMTDPSWGRGLPASMIDDATFRKAADQLFNEGFGLCLKWSQRDSISSFITTILEHVSAALRISRRTGLYELILLRQDYDPTTIPFFDANSGLINVDSDGTSAQNTSFNEIIVTYHDPIQNVDLEVRAQNIASWQSNQSVLSRTNSYPGICSPELATRVAARDLNQQALGLKKFVITLDQSGRYLAPGDVFAFADLTRGISFMVMRVGKVTCLQDVFALPATGYTATPVQEWIPPNNNPAVATQRAFLEANYRDLAHYLSSANLAAFPPTSGAVSMLAVNPDIVSATYQLATSVGSGVVPVQNGQCPWTPGGTLTNAIGLTDAALTIGGVLDTTGMQASGTPFAMFVDGEWMRVDAYDLISGVFNVGRGCIDTVPLVHAAGVNCFFADFTEGSDYLEYPSGDLVNASVLAQTGSGILPQDLAPVDTLTIAARQFRPYPPGLVTVNGTAYSAEPFAPGGADLVLAWASRNRVTQADALIDQTEASVAPETGTTYNVRVVNNGTVVRSVAGISALTWTYTAAEQAADAIGGVSFIELESERDGVVSWTYYSIQINVPPLGYGYGWGLDFGVNT
jgi:hypothetical protein